LVTGIRLLRLRVVVAALRGLVVVHLGVVAEAAELLHLLAAVGPLVVVAELRLL
jgi:hypothetical protein